MRDCLFLCFHIFVLNPIFHSVCFVSCPCDLSFSLFFIIIIIIYVNMDTTVLSGVRYPHDAQFYCTLTSVIVWPYASLLWEILLSYVTPLNDQYCNKIVSLRDLRITIKASPASGILDYLILLRPAERAQNKVVITPLFCSFQNLNSSFSFFFSPQALHILKHSICRSTKKVIYLNRTSSSIEKVVECSGADFYLKSLRGIWEWRSDKKCIAAKTWNG